MSDSCPTVKVADSNSEGGFYILNESDFDSKTMKLFKEPSKKKAPAKAKADKK